MSEIGRRQTAIEDIERIGSIDANEVLDYHSLG